MALRLPDFLVPVDATAGAPHVRGFWSTQRLSLVLLVGLVPPFIGAAATSARFFLVLAIAVALVIGWQTIFATVRRPHVDLDSLVTGGLFALLLPVDAPIWQIVLGVSFGVVIGEQIFGGRGRNLLNPVVVGMAFLIFSFPAGGYEVAGPATAYLAAPGAILLIATGLIAWQIPVAATVALGLATFLIGGANPLDAVLAGGFVFGIAYLASDPVCSAATRPGRWIYGALIGFLVFLGRTGSGGVDDGIVFAVLVAMIFAPLVDYLIILVSARLRSLRRG